MKLSLFIFALVISTVASAREIILLPGQSIPYGRDMVTCSAQPLPPPPPRGPRCELLGTGTYAGYNYDFRVAVDGAILVGKYNLTDALAEVNTLQTQGVCVAVATEACRLLGTGTYGGYNYDFRVAVGNEVIIGKYNQSDALSVMKSLRAANICL